MQSRPLTAALSDGVRNALTSAHGWPWENALPYGYLERPSPNFWQGRGTSRVRCVVWHITDGSGASALDWLRNPASDASANDLVMEDGSVVNLVRGDDTPWTNGPVNAPRIDFPIVLQTVAAGINPNRISYTIESAGKSSLGRGGALNERQVAALIVRTAQACMRYRLTADQDHILRHSYWDSVERINCPGFSKAEMVAWIDAVNWLTCEWRGW